MAHMPNITIRAFEAIAKNPGDVPFYESLDHKVPFTPIDAQMINALRINEKRNPEITCIAHDTVQGNWHTEYTTGDAISRLYTGFVDTVVFFGQTADHDIYTIMEAV